MDKFIYLPINPRIISTKYYNRYTINHTVIVVGYNDSNNTILIHDSLHDWGENVPIAQEYFEASLADYSSGQFHVLNETRTKSMIIISK